MIVRGTLSEAQQLLRLAHENQDYHTKTLLCNTIIHYKNKIFVPQTLQKRIIEWYHATLLHMSVTRTTKSINQHFYWKKLSTDIENYCKACRTCKHYKKYTQQYGILPTKIHNPKPWAKVCVDMLGPCTIPQDDKKKKNKAKDKDIVDIQELLVLSCLDPDTNFIKMKALTSKTSILVA
jgi:Integrase zinc binding domain